MRITNIACAVIISSACAASGGTSGEPAATPAAPRAQQQDTSALIPAGYGSLRQEEIALTLNTNGLIVRALPLDDNFIRTLSPDSYRTMLGQRESKRAAIDSIARRTGTQSVDLWYVSFFNEQPGEARFSPRDVLLTNQGRDFRPLEILPLTPGFGEYRVRQRQLHAAIYVFDGALDPNQVLTLAVETTRGGDWQTVLLRVERERATIRARAGR
ncbi:MAG TPA: hypothetical protein VJR92_09205 [Gemmatimonadaceae bacterium]|nr:hypothetical protein [Gemmatimonadaceae bacterium]